jgi:hypothetical protein
MQSSQLDNRVTRSSARPTPSAPAPPSSSTDPVIETVPVSVIDLPETPAIVPNPVDHLPPDEEIAILTADSDHRFAPGTSIDVRLQFLMALNLRLCDLDLAEIPPQLNSESQVFLLTFLNRRQNALTSLLTLTETRILRLRSSLAIHSAPVIAPSSSPSLSQSGMYKRLNSLKNYPVMTTCDVFWLDHQRHAHANGLTTLNERLNSSFSPSYGN